MPSNHNYVCFECRINVRRSKVAIEVPRCPNCGSECRSVGYKVPIPPKSDPQAWARLAELIRQRDLKSLLSEQKSNVQQLHKLERQLQTLERRPSNAARDRSIRELQRRVAEAKRFGG